MSVMVWGEEGGDVEVPMNLMNHYVGIPAKE